jgi:uncharacterized protein YxjI
VVLLNINKLNQNQMATFVSLYEDSGVSMYLDLPILELSLKADTNDTKNSMYSTAKKIVKTLNSLRKEYKLELYDLCQVSGNYYDFEIRFNKELLNSAKKVWSEMDKKYYYESDKFFEEYYCKYCSPFMTYLEELRQMYTNR